METKFDPKAKVKQGDLGSAADGKQPISKLRILTLINMHLEKVNLKLL